MEYEKKLKIAYNKINLAKNILLIGHLSPDADALSSIAAIIEILKKNKQKFYAFAKGKKEGYEFIPNENLINSEAPQNLSDFDLVITLDCGSLSRTGLEKEIMTVIYQRDAHNENQPFFIEIDHHEKIDDWSDLEIRRQGKASTSAMVYDLLTITNDEVDKEISECVLSGLMSDTGCLLYSNANAKAVALASKMLSHGASFNKILKSITKNSNMLSLKIWGRVIENLHFNPDTGLASSGLSEKELIELKNNSEEKEDLAADLFGVIVSFMCSLKGVKVALLLREEGEIIKASLRTNENNIDVAKLAGEFGGGGHKKAAGFSIQGRLLKTDKGWKVRKI